MGELPPERMRKAVEAGEKALRAKHRFYDASHPSYAEHLVTTVIEAVLPFLSAPPSQLPGAWRVNVCTCEVDFNCIEDGLLKAGVARVQGGIPKPGESVFLSDGEGNRCWGRVERVDGPLAYFFLDDSTWETVVVDDRVDSRPSLDHEAAYRALSNER